MNWVTNPILLQNIEERLTDDTLFVQSCDFFSGVLLQDYPPEVFLQNTGIVLNILRALRESNTLTPSTSVEQHAVSAISR